MSTQIETIRQFLSFEGVNQAYVAQQLYGGDAKKATAKLNNKLHGRQGRKFSEEEIDKLLEIRKRFFENIL